MLSPKKETKLRAATTTTTSVTNETHTKKTTYRKNDILRELYKKRTAYRENNIKRATYIQGKPHTNRNKYKENHKTWSFFSTKPNLNDLQQRRSQTAANI